MTLSVNEAKLTGLWAMNYTTIQQVLILKFEFGIEKLTDLSRNRPLERVYKNLKTTSRNTHTSTDYFSNTTRGSVSGIFQAASLRSLQAISIDFLNFSRRFELPNRETLFQWKSEIFNCDQLFTGWNPSFVGHLHLIRTKAAFDILIHSKQWMKYGELFHHQMLRLPGHLDCFIYLFFLCKTFITLITKNYLKRNTRT